MSANQTLDWGAGEYEITAAELQPVADHVVELAHVQPGQHVLDLATGTGQRRTGRRPPRRAGHRNRCCRAADRGRGPAGRRRALDISFIVGDIQELPFPDSSLDRVLSVFGLIFAPAADRALAELWRVLAPDGRGLIWVWVPSGAIDPMVGVFMRALSEVTGSLPSRFAWSEDAAVQELAARHGASARWHEGSLAISADSPEAYLATHERAHPTSVAMRPVLEQAGVAESVRLRALSALRHANERETGFLVDSPYRVIEVQAKPKGHD